MFIIVDYERFFMIKVKLVIFDKQILGFNLFNGLVVYIKIRKDLKNFESIQLFFNLE